MKALASRRWREMALDQEGPEGGKDVRMKCRKTVVGTLEEGCRYNPGASTHAAAKSQCIAGMYDELGHR